MLVLLLLFYKSNECASGYRDIHSYIRDIHVQCFSASRRITVDTDERRRGRGWERVTKTRQSEKKEEKTENSISSVVLLFTVRRIYTYDTARYGNGMQKKRNRKEKIRYHLDSEREARVIRRARQTKRKRRRTCTHKIIKFSPPCVPKIIRETERKSCVCFFLFHVSFRISFHAIALVGYGVEIMTTATATALR